jgi:hypothetical protein
VYREDPDEETWELVAQTKEELSAVIQELREGRAAAPPSAQEEEEEEEGLDEIIRYEQGGRGRAYRS